MRVAILVVRAAPVACSEPESRQERKPAAAMGPVAAPPERSAPGLPARKQKPRITVEAPVLIVGGALNLERQRCSAAT